MKNKYEYLANIFQEKLGEKFNLVFNNDESIEWENIIIEDMINGVMHVTGGGYDQINGYSVATQQLSIQFMIPTKLEIFSSAIQQIEDTFKGLHNHTFEFNGEIINVLFNYTSDANKVLVNGTDYASIYIYLNLFCVHNALMSNDTEIIIDGQKLKGQFHANYTNNHTADGTVRGNVTLIQTNSVNSIQQALSIDLVATKNDTLLENIMANANLNKIYDISYYNGIVTRTFHGYVVSLIEDGTINDTLKVKVVFGVANV